MACVVSKAIDRFSWLCTQTNAMCGRHPLPLQDHHSMVASDTGVASECYGCQQRQQSSAQSKGLTQLPGKPST